MSAHKPLFLPASRLARKLRFTLPMSHIANPLVALWEQKQLRFGVLLAMTASSPIMPFLITRHTKPLEVGLYWSIGLAIAAVTVAFVMFAGRRHIMPPQGNLLPLAALDETPSLTTPQLLALARLEAAELIAWVACFCVFILGVILAITTHALMQAAPFIVAAILGFCVYRPSQSALLRTIAGANPWRD